MYIIIKFALYQSIMIMCNMNDYICELIRYLENLLGEKVVVRELDESAVACLPIYITGAYKLYTLQLLGKDLILLCNTGEMQFAPAQIRKQKELVEGKTGKTPRGVFPVLPSTSSFCFLICAGANCISPVLHSKMRSFPSNCRVYNL